MKKFNKLISACLAVLLLLAVVPFSAGALSQEQEYVHIGLQVADEAFSGDINDMDTIYLELDAAAPLNEQEVILDELDLEGAVITGWKLWGIVYATPETDAKCDKIADLEPDFCFDSYIDDEFNDITSAYDELFIEPVIDRKYWFEEEPTAYYPYAKTNKTAESVQWYKYASKVVTKEVVEEVTDSAAQAKYYYLWEGSYNVEGYWEPSENENPNNPNATEYIIDMSVMLKEGESVEITLSEGFDGAVHQYENIEVFTKNGNVYTYTAQYEEEFNFYIHKATVPFTAEISMDVIDYDITAISGQDKALYTGEGNQLVACHASFESGEYVIKSDMVELGDCWIVKQPTKEDPTVETNKAADSYQWYTYEEVIRNYIYVDEVNDGTKELAFEEVDLSTSVPVSYFIGKNVLLSGEYSGDGWWKVSEGQYGSNGYDFDPDGVPCFFGGVFDFRKGDKFKVEIAGSASSDPEAPDYELNIYAESQTELWYEDDFEKDADGNYIVPDDAMLLSINVMTYNPDIKVKVTRTTTEAILEAVLGQTDKTFTGESGTYVVKATMDGDTVLTSLPVYVEKKSVDGGNNNNDNDKNNDGIPDTGDTTDITLWALIAILSAAAFVGSCYMRKTAK